jgi:hypothetical protein
MSTAPMPLSLAYVLMVKGCLKLGKAKTGLRSRLVSMCQNTFVAVGSI